MDQEDNTKERLTHHINNGSTYDDRKFTILARAPDESQLYVQFKDTGEITWVKTDEVVWIFTPVIAGIKFDMLRQLNEQMPEATDEMKKAVMALEMFRRFTDIAYAMTQQKKARAAVSVFDIELPPIKEPPCAL